MHVPAELVQAGGESMVDDFTEICNKIRRTGEWPTQMDSVTDFYTSMKGKSTTLLELQNDQHLHLF